MFNDIKLTRVISRICRKIIRKEPKNNNIFRIFKITRVQTIHMTSFLVFSKIIYMNV